VQCAIRARSVNYKICSTFINTFIEKNQWHQQNNAYAKSKFNSEEIRCAENAVFIMSKHPISHPVKNQDAPIIRQVYNLV